ncbi:hypothetical protein H072_7120 [Dactylellina haptotyla CBS 200.50]|uniref:Glycosyltransferase family 15 protein n=1 Tax=Dactylellina haptotyla (strain CBS 200.50) TaxID=1284197 RepID=S8BUV4_DACHA|nr:hypothetical protein H072_7120 [Dactylellina haptotyla CBS 200.50]
MYNPSNDRSPISPSFTANPFDKYKSAREGSLPDGIGGIGTGSWPDRFSARKKLGERKRIVRILIIAFLAGFLLWFFVTPLNWTGGTTAGELYTPPGTEGKASHDSNGEEKPVVPVQKPTEPKIPKDDRFNDDKEVLGLEKAAFVMLIRNGELEDALRSMKQIEDRFNHRWHYPWVFLNDVPFTEEFVRETTKRASGPTEYGLIPEQHWSVPPEIDQVKMRAAMKKMEEDRVIYGGSLSYRHMCRFNSGFFWRQPILDKYEWYWRVEPGIGFYCDVDYDVFEFMRTSNKQYGFTITLPEYKSTIPTLWKETVDFVRKHPEYLNSNSSLQYLLEDRDQGKSLTSDPPPEYNGCHFWSNFEIASLKFWRSPAYSDYFQHLDSAGGFFYERWGDAPVHSIAAALFLGTEQVHHFADMGYMHVPWSRCPQPDSFHKYAKCVCPFEPKDSFDLNGWSCQPRWWKIAGKEFGA